MTKDPWERLIEILVQVGEKEGVFYESPRTSDLKDRFEGAATRDPEQVVIALLAVVHHVKSEIARLEFVLGDTVLAARSSGASWTQIGRAVGTSKQAVLQKYGRRASREKLEI